MKNYQGNIKAECLIAVICRLSCRFDLGDKFTYPFGKQPVDQDYTKIIIFVIQ